MNDDEHAKNVNVQSAHDNPFTAPTKPQVHAQPGPYKEGSVVDSVQIRKGPISITNLEIFDLLKTMRSENAREVGDIKREVRGISEEQRLQRDDIDRLKRARSVHPAPVQRGRMHSYSEIDDTEAVSGSVLREAMQRQEREQAALATRQTLELEAQTLRIHAEAKAMLWKPVLATVSAIILGLATQYAAARGTITSEVRESTKEAVRESAPAIVKEAVEASKGTP